MDDDAEDFKLVKKAALEFADFKDSSLFSTNAGPQDKKSKADFVFLCGCKENSGKPCSEVFPQEELTNARLHHLELSRDELDHVILAQIRAGIKCGDCTACSKRKEQKKRRRPRTQYTSKSISIRRETFMHMHGIFKDRLSCTHSTLSGQWCYCCVLMFMAKRTEFPRMPFLRMTWSPSSRIMLKSVEFCCQAQYQVTAEMSSSSCLRHQQNLLSTGAVPVFVKVATADVWLSVRSMHSGRHMFWRSFQ